NMTHTGLLMGMSRYCRPQNVDYIFASHADPDIIASVNKWMVTTHAKVFISKLWTRFVPHFTTGKDYSSRIIGIPDPGMRIPLGNSELVAVPAHFLHSEGNFQFYDPVAKILFSGDLGVSLVDHEQAAKPVEDFDRHIPKMQAFHQRYMISNKILRFWANMARQIEIEMLVPQHGQRFVGKEMVRRFIDWIETLPCGVDLMTQDAYRIPL
ncbi:MAG: MBL fold metallo-hydrolase, partial [Tepidiphilus sp.]|nr:MBL fold metallo-hydrolase [Tepidiphilus sp.]MDD3434019.1 MBL fold metallo-hydrolase [Tepidiphilus sp.]